MKFAYYPGCSLKGTNAPYETSLLSLFKRLEIELVEIPDWNCCGATAYMSVDEDGALLMTSRNIALAEKMGLDIVAPCSSCYLNLLKTVHAIREQSDLGIRVCEALGRAKIDFDFKNLPNIKHPLQVLIDDYGVANIVKHKVISLDNVNMVPYYGCLLVRPYDELDHHFYPTKLDFLFESLGVHVVSDYPLKTRCCGGTLTGTIEDIGVTLNFLLLKEAKKRGGDVILTACPLCQFNLEMYQKKIRQKYGEKFEMPILYFSQALGTILGIGERDLGIQNLLYKPRGTYQSVREA
jgi:heterodisulfide reductase subunit B2